MLKKKDLKRGIMPPQADRGKKFNESEKLILKKFYTKYLKKYTPEHYNNIIVDVLTFNKNCHLVSIFKDSMIWDYVDEFLKRPYNLEESIERVPRFASFYKNYLKFFCKPVFANFEVNNIIQEYNEKKAELYYHQNFQGKKGGKDDLDFLDENDNAEEDDEKAISKSKIEKTIFDSTVKENIENNSIITIQNYNNKSEVSIALPDNDFNPTVNESGLLNQNSNEQSIITIMNYLTKTDKNGNQKMSNTINAVTNKFQAKKITGLDIKPSPHKNNSKFISYTNLCQKKNVHILKNSKNSKSSQTKSQVHFKNSFNTKSRNVFNGLGHMGSTSNNNLNFLTKNTNKFKTFDFLNINSKNKKSLVKTQNVETILNRISTNQSSNPNNHKKNNYSIDNLLNKNQIKNVLTKKKNSSMGSNHQLLKSTHSIKTPKSMNKNQTSKSRKPPLNSTSNLNSNHQKSQTTNDDIMKITLSLLMNGSSGTKNLSQNKLLNSNKHIQNVNININNQININNNVQLQGTFSPKQLNSKLLHNEKVDMNINNNLNRILSAKVSSEIREDKNKRSRNKASSYDINNCCGTSTSNIVYCSCSGIDKRHLGHNFGGKISNKTVYNGSNTLFKSSNKISRITTEQLFQSMNKIKPSHPTQLKKNLNFKFKPTSTITKSQNYLVRPKKK